MTNNYPTQPLNTRPKVHDNRAVEAWLKDNKPTVLPAFDSIKPKPTHKARANNKAINKAKSVIAKYNVCRLTYRQFLQMCGDDVAFAKQVKTAIKANFGLTLKTVHHTTQTGKVVLLVEIG